MGKADSTQRATRLVIGIATLGALLWTGGTFLAPWLTAHDSVLGGWMRLVYRPGCHQIADRCLDFGFGPMAVCARCAGLYIGGCLGLLWTLIRNTPTRPRPLWLAAFAIPTVLDFAAGQLGLPSFGSWIRMVVASAGIWALAVLSGTAGETLHAAKYGKNRHFVLGGAITGPTTGVWLSMVAVQHAPVGIASTLMALPPVLLIPLERWIFREPISGRAIAGTLVALCGAAVLFLI